MYFKNFIEKFKYVDMYKPIRIGEFSLSVQGGGNFRGDGVYSFEVGLTDGSKPGLGFIDLKNDKRFNDLEFVEKWLDGINSVGCYVSETELLELIKRLEELSGRV